jgi:hypothetical protein
VSDSVAGSARHVVSCLASAAEGCVRSARVRLDWKVRALRSPFRLPPLRIVHKWLTIPCTRESTG